jgi:hypothetical protein
MHAQHVILFALLVKELLQIVHLVLEDTILFPMCALHVGLIAYNAMPQAIASIAN